MRIDKIINNNIISSFDENNREIIVMGRGLGFGRRPGDLIDDKQVEKVFRLDNEVEMDRLDTVFEDIPVEHINVTKEIISYAKTIISNKLNKNIYITLTDHINFAIERYKQGLIFNNPLNWEIKKFYALEYKVGEKAIEMIHEKLGISLPSDEIASIALHFVNAEFGTGMQDTFGITKIINNILKIVKYHYKIELDENTLNYERFISYLKFFAQSIVTNQANEGNEEEFHKLVKRQYQSDYKCAEKIKSYIEEECKLEVPCEELVYLTIHLRKIAATK